MWHAQRTKFPFKVYIADGGDDPAMAALLEDGRHFPDVDYTYVRYNDATLTDFFRKMAHAADRIDTPYMMISDNDDFVLPMAVTQSAQYLDKHADYVSAAATTASFPLWPIFSEAEILQGDLYSLEPQTDCTNMEANGAERRMETFFHHRSALYYNVNRVSTMRQVYNAIPDLGFRNFDLWEFYMYLAMLSHGKAKALQGIGYLRQLGTSQTHAFGRGWVYGLFYKNWIDDLETVITNISSLGESGDAEAFAGKLRQAFYENSSVSGRPPAADRLAPMRHRLKGFAAIRAMHYRRSWSRLAGPLAKRGVDIPTLAAEIAAVRETCASPELSRFIRAHAPTLMDSPA